MENSYLIPANSKKSLLLFNLFNKTDLIMFGIGIGVTLILLLALPIETLLMAFIALAPALITGFLVLPVPYYHNILTVIKSALSFFLGRRDFVWKGWGLKDGETKE